MFFATPLKNETWGNNKMYTRVWRCFMAKHNRKKITFCRAITSLYMHYSCNSTTFISYMLVTYSRCEPITYFLFSSMDSCQLLLLMFNPTRNFLLLFICRFLSISHDNVGHSFKSEVKGLNSIVGDKRTGKRSTFKYFPDEVTIFRSSLF